MHAGTRLLIDLDQCGTTRFLARVTRRGNNARLALQHAAADQ
jgi:hypothetical protein